MHRWYISGNCDVAECGSRKQREGIGDGRQGLQMSVRGLRSSVHHTTSPQGSVSYLGDKGVRHTSRSHTSSVTNMLSFSVIIIVVYYVAIIVVLLRLHFSHHCFLLIINDLRSSCREYKICLVGCGAWWLSGRMPDSQSSEPGFESLFATISKIGHFHSLR